VFTTLPVEMRVAPTALEQSGTAGDYQTIAGNIVNCTAVPTFNSASRYSVSIGLTAAQTAGQGVAARAVATTYLGFSGAEL
jgi:hypothetical protein